MKVTNQSPWKSLVNHNHLSYPWQGQKCWSPRFGILFFNYVKINLGKISLIVGICKLDILWKRGIQSICEILLQTIDYKILKLAKSFVQMNSSHIVKTIKFTIRNLYIDIASCNKMKKFKNFVFSNIVSKIDREK